MHTFKIYTLAIFIQGITQHHILQQMLSKISYCFSRIACFFFDYDQELYPYLCGCGIHGMYTWCGIHGMAYMVFMPI